MSSFSAHGSEMSGAVKASDFLTHWQTFVTGGLLRLERQLELPSQDRVRPVTTKEFIDLSLIATGLTQSGTEACRLLHGQIKLHLSNYCSNVVLPALRAKKGAEFLSEVQKRIDNQGILREWYYKFFYKLESYFLKREDGSVGGSGAVGSPGSRRYIKEEVTFQFRTLVFDEIKAEVAALVIEYVNMDRNGEQIDRGAIRSAISMFLQMSTPEADSYNNDFVVWFLSSTHEYFRLKSNAWLSLSTPEYLVRAEFAFREETDRCSHSLSVGLRPALLKVLEEELLQKHQTDILEKSSTGVVCMLASDRTDDVARVLRLYGRIENGLQLTSKLLKTHIIDQGKGVITGRANRVKDSNKPASSDDTEFVEGLFALHHKYFSLITENLSKGQTDRLLFDALKHAFQYLVNDAEMLANIPTAEILAVFCHGMQKNSAKKPEELLRKDIDNVMQMFVYLQDKDLFEIAYRKHLSKRLLDKSSASDEIEKLMIDQLTQSQAANFTSKIRGMWSDIPAGGKFREDFAAHFAGLPRESSDQPAVVAEVQTLNLANWPSEMVSVCPKLILPPQMANIVNTCNIYNSAKSASFKLMWCYGQGKADVDIKAGSKKIVYKFHTLQAVVMLAFNNVPSNQSVPFQDLLRGTCMDQEVLKKILGSLSYAKDSCLKRNKRLSADDDKKKTISESDSFSFDVKGFETNAKKRVEFAAPPSLEDSKRTDREVVVEDRKDAIKACIVRIMKTRKVCALELVLHEVQNQLANFRPEPRVVKAQVEFLIQNNYLERNPNNSAELFYRPEG